MTLQIGLTKIAQEFLLTISNSINQFLKILEAQICDNVKFIYLEAKF